MLVVLAIMARRGRREVGAEIVHHGRRLSETRPARLLDSARYHVGARHAGAAKMSKLPATDAGGRGSASRSVNVAG